MRERLGGTEDTVQFHAETADASDEEALNRAIAGCEQRLGPASVLVYNVGQMTIKPLVETTLYEFEHGFAVNVGGVLTSAKAVLPRMMEERRGTTLLTGG